MKQPLRRRALVRVMLRCLIEISYSLHLFHRISCSLSGFVIESELRRGLHSRPATRRQGIEMMKVFAYWMFLSSGCWVNWGPEGPVVTLEVAAWHFRPNANQCP